MLLPPWSISKKDVYYKIVTGWSLESFDEWLVKTSEKYGLSKEDLLSGIVETIRKISYQTIEILEWQTKIRNKVQIPPFIITLKLKSYNAAISAQLRNGKNFDDLCDKKEFLSTLGPFGQIAMELAGIRKLCRFIGESVRVNGVASEFLIVYSQFVVQRAFEEFLKTFPNSQSSENSLELSRSSKEHLIKVVVEETMHYFDYQTNPQLMDNLFKRVREKVGDTKDPEKLVDAEQEVEVELGLKDRAEQIFLILKNDINLFLPLEMRLSCLGLPLKMM